MAAPPLPRDPLFEVEHLSLAHAGSRGQPPASILKNVSVAVERGGALVLVGSSGSGKSTLPRCLNRLAEPTGGSARFDGRDVRSPDPRDLRRRAALGMQTPVFFEGSVLDSLRVPPASTPGWLHGHEPGRNRRGSGPRASGSPQWTNTKDTC